MRKKPAVQKSKYDATLLTPQQARAIEGEIRDAEKMFKNYRDKISDPASFFKDVAKKKRLLKDHEAVQLKGAEANKAFARAKEIAAKLSEVMPGKKDYFRPYPKGSTSMEYEGDFERAVSQQMKVQTDPKVKQMVREYKHIMRRLDPQNPTVSNIEGLRK